MGCFSYARSVDWSKVLGKHGKRDAIIERFSIVDTINYCDENLIRVGKFNMEHRPGGFYLIYSVDCNGMF